MEAIPPNNKDMKKIAIFGSGGFGREVHMLIEQINIIEKTWVFIGYFDDGISKGTLINSYPILGNIDDLNSWPDEINISIAIGNPITKAAVFNKITNIKVQYPNLIHPSVITNGFGNKIGKGCIICNGNIITVNTSIGNFIILNLACTIGHDSVIEDFCSFMPAVNISGEVIIRQYVYVGTGVKIINQLEIGERTIVGAGAVVYKSLPANCTALGIPAKPIKYNNE